MQEYNIEPDVKIRLTNPSDSKYLMDRPRISDLYTHLRTAETILREYKRTGELDTQTKKLLNTTLDAINKLLGSNEHESQKSSVYYITTFRTLLGLNMVRNYEIQSMLKRINELKKR